jgi:hypothetical protein
MKKQEEEIQSVSVSVSVSVSGSRSLRGWFSPTVRSSRRHQGIEAWPTLAQIPLPRRGRKGLEMIARTPGSPCCMYVHPHQRLSNKHAQSPPTHLPSPLCAWTIRRLEIRLLPALASSSPSCIFFIKRRYPRQEETPSRCLVKPLTHANFGLRQPNSTSVAYRHPADIAQQVRLILCPLQ